MQIRYACPNDWERDKGQNPILLLSPLPESILAFLPTWEMFSALGPVVAVDLPRFGRSEVARTMTPENAVSSFFASWMLSG